MATIKKINRNLDDLHIDDRLNRLRLRDWMAAEQERQNIGHRELAARMGHQTGWAYGIITGGGMWRAASIQRIVRALGFALHFNVDTKGVQVAPRTDPSISEICAGLGVDKREEAARMDLGDLGRRYREACRLTPAMLGRRLNQEGESVRTFESGDKPYYLVVTAQRYFRALGGELKFSIERLDGSGECFEAPDGRWSRADGSEVNIVELEDRTLVWNTKSPETVVSFPQEAWKAWMNRD